MQGDRFDGAKRDYSRDQHLFAIPGPAWAALSGGSCWKEVWTGDSATKARGNRRLWRRELVDNSAAQ